MEWSADPDERFGQKFVFYGVMIGIVLFLFFFVKDQVNQNIQEKANKTMLSRASITTSQAITGNYAIITVSIKNNADKPITNGLGVYLKDITGNEHLVGYVNILVEPGMTRIGQVSKSLSDIKGPGPYVVVTRW